MLGCLGKNLGFGLIIVAGLGVSGCQTTERGKPGLVELNGGSNEANIAAVHLSNVAEANARRRGKAAAERRKRELRRRKSQNVSTNCLIGNSKDIAIAADTLEKNVTIEQFAPRLLDTSNNRLQGVRDVVAPGLIGVYGSAGEHGGGDSDSC